MGDLFCLKCKTHDASFVTIHEVSGYYWLCRKCADEEFPNFQIEKCPGGCNTYVITGFDEDGNKQNIGYCYSCYKNKSYEKTKIKVFEDFKEVLKNRFSQPTNIKTKIEEIPQEKKPKVDKIVELLEKGKLEEASDLATKE